jgi:hypothetical protein
MNKLYEYDDNMTIGVDENIPIRITEGKYEGLVYRYGKIGFIEEGEVLRCNFTYDVLENPKDITEDQELVDFLGEIVIDVLEDEMKEIGDDFLRAGETKEDREDD